MSEDKLMPIESFYPKSGRKNIAASIDEALIKLMEIRKDVSNNADADSIYHDLFEVSDLIVYARIDCFRLKNKKR